MKVYIDAADWWVGLYRGPNHYYVCLLPCVVIRWARRRPKLTEGRLSVQLDVIGINGQSQQEST